MQLAYHPPYDWDGVLSFLATRALTGIEWVTDSFYARTVQLGDCKGWIKVTRAPNKKSALLLEFSQDLTPVLASLQSQVRDLFDLDARPDVIAKQLGKDTRLAPLLRRTPGMRVPGAFNGFELGLRAIIGQQVTVKAATTLTCRFVAAFGENIVTPFPELNRLTPTPARVSTATVDGIAKLGIVSARSKCIIALAQAESSGKVTLDQHVLGDPDAAIARLTALPGIGEWTAHYIAMRALRWRDAFPKGDIAIRNNLGGVSAREADEMSQAWRPWRSYAVLYIWNATKPARAAAGRGPAVPSA